MKKNFAQLLLLVLTVLGSSLSVHASEFDESELWNEFRGSTAKAYVTDADLYERIHSIIPKHIKNAKDVLVEKNIIKLEETGRACFIDAIACYQDDTFENIAVLAEWTSQDESIVSVYAGHVIAGQQGTTTVIVDYQNIRKEITVIVEKTIDVAAKIEELNSNMPIPFGMTSSERDSAVQIAKGMVECTWTPVQNVVKWKGGTFSAGVSVTGIPYSQTPYQKDKQGFINSMSYAGFYIPYVRQSDNKNMAQYGNDCSAFVSFCWGISRNTTQGFLKGIMEGNYASLGGGYSIRKSGNEYLIQNYDDITVEEAYGNVVKGDAIIQYGHMRLVAANSPTAKVIYTYEQTPDKAKYTSYSYSELVKGEYIPFTKY